MGNKNSHAEDQTQLKNPTELDSYILINILYVHVPVHS